MEIDKLRSYFSDTLKWGWGYEAQAVFEFLCSAASKLEGGGVVLDAGAGRKRYSPYFEGAIYLSQEHAPGISFKGMSDVSYDLIGPIDEKILLKDNSIDLVLSTSVLEHLRYPEKFIRDAFRVLRPYAVRARVTQFEVLI